MTKATPVADITTIERPNMVMFIQIPYPVALAETDNSGVSLHSLVTYR